MESLHGLLDDSGQIYEDLRAEGERLCTPTSSAPDVMLWPFEGQSGLFRIVTRKDLGTHLNSCSTTTTSRIIILKQEHTLGRLLISLPDLQQLLDTYEPFPPFISTTRTFGRNGSDEHYSGHHHRVSSTKLEICYDVRYPALHGRKGSGPPWSMRHMAAYQAYDTKALSSRLIFIGPSKEAQARLGRVLGVKGALEDSPMLPHIVILEAAERDWEAYLKYIRTQFEEIANMARYSRVGATNEKYKVFRYSTDPQGALVRTEVPPSNDSDFKLCLRDIQRLDTMHEQLSRCTTIIETSMDIGQDCLDFCQHLDATVRPEIQAASSNKLGLYIRRMKMHGRAVDLLAGQLEKTAQTLSQILEIRNDEEAIKSSHVMRDMLKVLTDLGKSAKDESESMRVLAQRSAKDGRFTTILTFAAMLYLPASLVATVFSSNLVQMADGTNPATARFVPAAQFWLFPVLSLLLTTVTILPALYVVDRSQSKILSRNKIE